MTRDPEPAEAAKRKRERYELERIRVTYASLVVAMIGAFFWTAVAGGWVASPPESSNYLLFFALLAFVMAYVLCAAFIIVRTTTIVANRIVVFFTCTVLDFVAVFAYAYETIERQSPHSFGADLSRLDAIYVSVTTLTTVGPGTLAPRTEFARAVVTVESSLSVLLVAVGLALLVSHLRPANDG